MTDAPGSLFSDALNAPEDVSAVSDVHGRTARIEREPSYPGARRVYLDPPSSHQAVQQLWSLPPASSRPDFYPSGVPFVPDIACFVIEKDDGLLASWRPELRDWLDSDAADAVRNALPLDLTEALVSARKRAEAGTPASSPAREVARLLREHFTEARLGELLASGPEPQQVDDRFRSGYAEALRQCHEAGWSEAADGPDASYAVASARLRKAGRRRTLTLLAIFGTANLVLIERPA